MRADILKAMESGACVACCVLSVEAQADWRALRYVTRAAGKLAKITQTLDAAQQAIIKLMRGDTFRSVSQALLRCG